MQFGNKKPKVVFTQRDQVVDSAEAPKLMTLMPLLRHEGFTFEKLQDVISRDYGALNLSIKPLSPASRSPLDPLLFELEGNPITVMSIDGPVPAEQFHWALKTNVVWKEAEKAVQAHTAHLVVACTGVPKDHIDAINMAAYVSVVSAALAGMTPCLAVYWSAGDTITQGVQWRERTKALLKKEIPIDLWLQFRFMPGGPSYPDKSLACITTGLQAFVGREIEFRPEVLSPGDIFQRVSGMALYLMQQGLVVKDGDTVGASETEIIRVTYRDEGGRRHIPILSLTCGTIKGGG